MNISSLKFPYPVLGKLGDINKEWKYYIEAECTDEYINYNIEIVNEFQDLVNLIQNQKATYAFEIRCEKTFLRTVHLSYEPKFTISLSRRDLRDRLEITGYIIATKDQDFYQSDDFKPVYKSMMKFMPRLEKGEILGYTQPHIEHVGINYDNLGDTSLIEWKKGGEDCAYESVNYHRENIQVILPPKIFQKLNRIKNNVQYTAILQSSFIYNALYTALPHIDDADEGIPEKQWAQVIHQILKDAQFEGLSIENDLSTIVQMLLQEPYERMLNDLEQINIVD